MIYLATILYSALSTEQRFVFTGLVRKIRDDFGVAIRNNTHLATSQLFFQTAYLALSLLGFLLLAVMLRFVLRLILVRSYKIYLAFCQKTRAALCMVTLLLAHNGEF